MNYIIIESQTNNGTTAVVTPAVYTDRNSAESSYHTKLAAAAISSVEIHSVCMLTEDGRTVRSEWYAHPAEVSEEPEEPEDE